MRYILILLLISHLSAFSQDLTGTWVGNTGSSYLKLVVIQRGDSVFGYTYDSGPGYCKATFSGTLNEKIKLKGKGMEMLQNSGSHGLANYNLNYSIDGGQEYLTGSTTLKGALLKILTLGIPTPTRLKKESKSVDTIAYMRQRISRVTQPAVVTQPVETIQPNKEEPVIPVVVKELPVTPQPPVISIADLKKQRASKLVKNIFTNDDTVRILLYDNGDIDNDTVTIFFDNVIVLDRYRISDKAKELLLPIRKNGQQHSIELFANNLGSIPPNTALVVIMAGKERHELRASYDLETNAQIFIQYKE